MRGQAPKPITVCAIVLAVCGCSGVAAQDLAFEPNRGQFAPAVSFAARGSNYAISLTGAGATLGLRGQSASMRVVGGRAGARGQALDPQSGYSNYLIGSDPAQWRTGIPHFSRVQYSDVYPGIDLIYYGNQRQLEYDFVVSPNADPARIGLEFAGADRIGIAPNGDLTLRIANADLRLLKPDIYQQIHGVRRHVAGHYLLHGGNRVGFGVAAYDRRFPLIIDPVLTYATYLGGSADEVAYGVATDSAGNSYVAGYTSSTDFPASAGAYQTGGQGGSSDAFVAKYSSAGTLIYATYLGGSGADTAWGIAVDSAGNAYITGSTASPNFPATSGAYSGSLTGASNAFVSKLNAAGNGLVYSTYLGGSGNDIAYGVAVDTASEATLTGSTSSSNFPTTAGALRAGNGGGATDAFVARVNGAGTALVFSTYIGGSGTDAGYAVALDASGNAYITGYTNSANFPHTPGVAQGALAGDYDAFVTAINPTGTALLYSTFLGGGAQDYGTGIAVDSNGNAYIAGTTASSNYPVTSGVLQTAAGGGYDAMVTKLTPSGTLAYSTLVGGNADDFGLAIAVDASGNAYIAGDTASTNFPTTPDALQTTASGAFNIFVAQINPAATALGYSTYLGGSGFETAYGIALDAQGTAWVAGYTVSTDFPVTAGAAQANSAGGSDALVMKVVSCGYSLSSPGISVLIPASTGTVGLTALGACPWTVSSNVPWLIITSPVAGAGSATINYSFSANTSTPRSGILTVAGIPFTVNQTGPLLTQSIAAGSLSNVTFGVAPFSVGATASSGLPVTFSSNTISVCTVSASTVTILATGTCSITASQAGSPSYAGAPNVLQSFTVSPASQTIVFSLLSNVASGTAAFPVSATASSGLAVSFASTTTTICTVSGSVVTILLAGTCSITASQAGNANYAGAANVVQSFTVTQPACSVAINTTNTSGYGGTVSSAGGTGAINVFAPSSCTWSAGSNASWLTITSPTGGSAAGNGTVTWSATPNTTASALTATLSIGDQQYILIQSAAPACSVTLSPQGVTHTGNTVNLSDAPTSFLVNVTADPSCTWTANSNNVQINILVPATDVSGNPEPATVPSVSTNGFGILNLQLRRNTSSQPQTGTFTVNGATLTVIQAGSTFDANTRFIYAMYDNVLAREPDAGGLAAYQAGLANGTYTRDLIGADMFGAPEFNLVERFTVGLYFGILGRDPEYFGWDFQRRYLQLNITQQGTETAAFLNSTEYGLKYGTPDVPTFVTEMYQNAFSRTPAPSEITSWETSIAATSEVGAAQSILNSPEFVTGKSVRQTVFLIHAALLGRVPTAAEYTNYANQLNGTTTTQQAIAEIVTGAEFLAKIGP